MRRFFQILTCLGLILAGYSAQAQVSLIEAEGTIRNQSGIPIPNQPYTLEAFDANLVPLANFTSSTNNSGTFTDTIPIVPSQDGILVLSTTDCQGATVADSLSFADTAFQVKVFDLSICSGGTGCQAAFNTTQTNFTVTFSNQSANIPTAQYQWDFGDGNTSTQFSPTHTYAAAGNYQVTLLQTDTVQNCLDTTTQFLSVCTAEFSADTFGLTVDFTPLDTGAISYLWDFGDGNSSTQVTPTHTYAQPGIYGVSLLINTAGGCFSSYFDSVQVGNQTAACSANFLANTLPNNQVQFFNLSNPLDSFAMANYVWEFGDGTVDSSSFCCPIKTYNSPGTYEVCFSFTTLNGCSASYCDSVVVGNACQAGFTFDTTGQAVNFTNTSQGNNLNYFWSFGDGVTSTAISPNHTYLSAGTYSVCLLISNNAGCVDSLCQSITVGPAGANCSASFIPLNQSNGQIVFQNSSVPVDSTLISSFVWDFGDGNFDSVDYAVTAHQYNGFGPYQVCLTIETVGGCVDTYCDSVFITNAGNCQADFNATTSGLTANFTNTSIAGPNAVYNWFFGDSVGTSTQVNPSYTYPSAGTYSVILTLIDSTAGGICTDAIVQQVTVSNGGGGNSGTFSISGAVIADSMMPIFDGQVYLIEYDSLTGTLTAVDSTSILGSFYQFTGITPGDYLIKAALQPNSPFYTNYLPTYLGDELFWFDAVGTVVTNGNVVNPTINLIAGSNPGGPGFIGGSVSQGANKTTGDPVSGVSVLIFTANEEPVEHVKTDVDGNFSFDNLPYGTYHLYVDMMNHYSERHVITLTADEPRSMQAIFEVVGNEVVATSLDNDLLADGLKAYPNPALERLRVEMTLTQPAEVSLRLINLMGQTLMQQSLGQRQGRLSPELNVGALPAGIYTLEVQTDQQTATQRIVIRR